MQSDYIIFPEDELTTLAKTYIQQTQILKQNAYVRVARQLSRINGDGASGLCTRDHGKRNWTCRWKISKGGPKGTETH
jgi:hypothetical protein